MVPFIQFLGPPDGWVREFIKIYETSKGRKPAGYGPRTQRPEPFRADRACRGRAWPNGNDRTSGGRAAGIGSGESIGRGCRGAHLAGLAAHNSDALIESACLRFLANMDPPRQAVKMLPSTLGGQTKSA